jgi:cytosine/adenosine deaminase-related metal-dependent hydrolase
MEWLHTYTFPIESAHSDPECSMYRYGRLVRRLLANGTTTAAYFGSLHLAPNKVLVDAIEQQGQRAVVGKVRRSSTAVLCRQNRIIEQQNLSLVREEQPMVDPPGLLTMCGR